METSVSSYLYVGVKLTVLKRIDKQVHTRYNEINGKPYQKQEIVESFVLSHNDHIVATFEDKDSLYEFIENLEDNDLPKGLSVYRYCKGWDDDISEVVIGIELSDLSDEASLVLFSEESLINIFIETKNKLQKIKYLKDCHIQLHHILDIN